MEQDQVRLTLTWPWMTLTAEDNLMYNAEFNLMFIFT